VKEIVLGELTPLGDLADLLDVPAARLVEAGFHDLGLLLTIRDVFTFEQASLVAATFGWRARRQDT
jgi:hypothetical protein